MRRYDLDWLRVIAFGLLIFYHVGMLFVPWDFHIKNNNIYQWLTYPMWFLNQWRLPLLFIISGMGTYYSLQKRTGGQFIRERNIRLLIPFIFGMLFVIPPQVYIERLVKNQFTGSYLDFWPSQAFIGSYPEGNISWHHLWFILYLLLFSLILTPLFLYIKKHTGSRIHTSFGKLVTKPMGLYLIVIPLYLTEVFVEPFFPVTHALVGDWFAIIFYLILFLSGFILITFKDHFWSTVKINRRSYLIAGVISFSLMLIITRTFEDSFTRHITEALLKVVNLWSWILALFGYAAKYLNKESKQLHYLNRAVYPFYILHQTVILVVAYYLIDLEWSFGLKFSILSVGTFGISWLVYEYLIRRWIFIYPLFGVKKIKIYQADAFSDKLLS